jgi:undecaprenyl-diphosphatase
VLWAAGGTVIAWGIAHYGLKPLFGEVRPYNTLHGVEVLVARTNGYSFPSGHATIAGAVIMGLWLTKDKPLAWIATVASGLLGFDRIYVGAHYPFDVIAGMIFGCLVLLALFLPLVKLLTWFDNFLIKHTPFSPMVLAKTNWRPYPDYFDKQAS